MDETSHQQQPREPGVRYRTVKGKTLRTTVIDGVASTREVTYDAWEPVPPRDWDAVVWRAVITVVSAVTLIAIVGTTASVGGLLSVLVPAGVAYGMGAVFTAVWLACLGIEWLNRVNPASARAARAAGCVVLCGGVLAVSAYGYTLGQPIAGAVGASVDVLAKGLWALVIRHHAVPLDEDVAHWVTQQEQRLAGRELLAARLARLNRRAAFQRAVGGPEIHAAAAIMASADTGGQRPEASAVVVAPAPSAVPAPAAPVAAPVVFAPVPAPAPVAPPAAPVVSAPVVPAAPVGGHVADTADRGADRIDTDLSAPVSAAVSAQATAPPAAPTPARAPVQRVADKAGTRAAPRPARGADSGQNADVLRINAPKISVIVRAALKRNPRISNEALLAKVIAAHGPRTNLDKTVARLRRRVAEENKKLAESS